MEREVVYHLGVLECGLDDKYLDKDCIFNADESHLMINHDNGRTLAMKADKVLSAVMS